MTRVDVYRVRSITGVLAGCLLAMALHPGRGTAAEPAGAASAETDPVATHLQRGQAYLEQGEYARAVLEFEQVLRFDNLPPDLREQLEIYARAAANYEQGKRLSGFGYAETGGGLYRENYTRTTTELGGDPVRDWFWKARLGGGLSWITSGDVTLDGSLDYRFVRYDDKNRRNDENLRWNAAMVQSVANGSRSVGVRGEASYRGNGGYRQDYGLYVNRTFMLNPDNEILVEGEFRSREYPRGAEREFGRDTAQIWLGWTRALSDGAGALTVTINAGRAWATGGRAGGDQSIYGIETAWTMDIRDRFSAFLFGFWEHNGLHDAIPLGDEPGLTVRPELDIYEFGAGLTYGFAPGWSVRPEVLYIRDEGNTPLVDYSATELWAVVRRSF